jgi:hypothetical protein
MACLPRKRAEGTHLNGAGQDASEHGTPRTHHRSASNNHPGGDEYVGSDPGFGLDHDLFGVDAESGESVD